MSISNNFRDRDRAAWKENTTDGGTDRRVCDSTAHGKLDEIRDAVSGTVDTSTSIINKVVAIANTEVSQALPANTKGFTVRSRLKSKILLAYSAGGTSTSYVSIMPGKTYQDTNFYSGQTLYFQSTKAGDTLEIVAHV